jgi:hypothetical protein
MTLLYKSSITQPAEHKKAYILLLTLFLLTQWGENFFLYRKNTPKIPELHSMVSNSIGMHRGDRIVAPIIFVFDQMENFNIQSFYVYKVMSSQKTFNLKKDFFDVASKDHRKYIILMDEHIHDLGIDKLNTGERFGEYAYAGKYGPYHVFSHSNLVRPAIQSRQQQKLNAL